MRNNNTIAFLDIETNSENRKILDLGCVREDGNHFRSTDQKRLIEFLKRTRFVAGHNIFDFDLTYIGEAITNAGIGPTYIIDTLPLSPLLFPARPYHALLKDDKLQTDELNNPLNDALKARDLFYDEIEAFNQLDPTLRHIYYLLLHRQKKFSAFFRFIQFRPDRTDLPALIRKKFGNRICQNLAISEIILDFPVELAYCLALINAFIDHGETHSITPPWVLKQYPGVEPLMTRLRNLPCEKDCTYCHMELDIHRGLHRFFHFDSFRTFDGESLQEEAVRAAVNHRSILTIFPTGGGKSITFQLPALISGESVNGLTVVISPLQSLMKDQVDNLEKMGITQAVTINGLLDPIERANAIERVQDGSAAILYISPESLRSRTIERLILQRKIARFVIDEAHCFSAWGQDFRVDYLYIGDFIKSVQEKKNLWEPIPISCFTATAKQKVIQDIREYFQEKLALNLEVFASGTSRTNLHYTVKKVKTEEERYTALRDLIETHSCPTIVYVSRTRKATELAQRLGEEGFNAKPFHGKMDAREKTKNQNAFIEGEIQIMVATSAFGMGVDKKDVGLVIHYNISDSLENYIQEAGRAGRDENILADCYVLYNEEDLSKHFILLNQSKISIREIKQIWKAIIGITKFRSSVSNSALEIARRAGWDDSVLELETRVTSAIAALEDAGYIRRGQNMPRIFANSLRYHKAQDAIDLINTSSRFDEKQKTQAIRIVRKLFSSKNKYRPGDEEAESRIDYISDHLAISQREVITIVNLLREEKILADAKDLTAFVKTSGSATSSQIAKEFSRIERSLYPLFDRDDPRAYDIKELNEYAEKAGCESVTTAKIMTILRFWSIQNWVQLKRNSNGGYTAIFRPAKHLNIVHALQKRHELSAFISDLLVGRCLARTENQQPGQKEVFVEFSVLELKNSFNESITAFKGDISLQDVEDALYYLSKIDAIKIEGGFMVTYNRLYIERLEQNNRKQYTQDDYKKLDQFYQNKVQQIHIVGEYAQKMLSDYEEALRFVEDYFQLEERDFLKKYFPGSKLENLKMKINQSKFNQLFGQLSPTQLKIIRDFNSQYIVVLAGPGSGKTKLLVHKLASLYAMEDIKHEQMLMLTFSRAAVTEFKKRLIGLIGNAAHFIEIKTFHSYCFDLMGRVGSLEKSGQVIREAIEWIEQKKVELSRITKMVLVIDEAQDMDEDEYKLIKILMKYNIDMRVIAVGDDDQNIYEFRGSSSEHLENLLFEKKATRYELVENYRSKKNLVELTNHFARQIERRLKTTDIYAHQPDYGQIRVTRYSKNNLIKPLVSEIMELEWTGSTAILTTTNDQAAQITGLLLKLGKRAKLIQSNTEFNLFNLVEFRHFIELVTRNDSVYLIQQDSWDTAINDLKNQFSHSSKLELCLDLLQDFNLTHPRKKYKTDLEIFIRESRLEDLYGSDQDTIYVSTIHKAKGKEFENVFMMLENYYPTNDEQKRLIYVGMSRAKKNLSIHLNSGFMDDLLTENTSRFSDHQDYDPPEEIILQLTHRDVRLGSFESKQELIADIVSGDELLVYAEGCLDVSRRSILYFSTNFRERIYSLSQDHFEPVRARVNHIVYWPITTQQEIKIILPEVVFQRKI